MPMPVSLTRKSIQSRAVLRCARRRASVDRCPFSVNLQALLSRLNRTWRTLVRSARIAPMSGRDVDLERVAVLLDQRLDGGGDVARPSSRTSNVSRYSSILPASILERSRMSLMSASRCLPGGVDLLAGRARRPRSAGSPSGLLLEHFAVADDGVQRRAQFVAHVGQELALGLVGALGGLHQHLQLLVALFELGVGAGEIPAGEAEAAGHAVEGVRELAQLVLAGEFDVGFQVARAQGIGAGFEGVHAAGEVAGDEEGEAGGEQAGEQEDQRR